MPGSDDPGAAYVQSGRTGRILHKFVGQPGDQNGFAITDAGDIDRDGVHDILSGAPRQNGDTEGHAYLYSGRTGRLLHTFAGATTGDAFGTAVTSADVNRDGRNDLVIGAAYAPGGGLAYVYSGRTFKLLYTIPPPDTTHLFGYGTGMTEDLDRDHVPDLIVGGGGTAHVFSGRDGHLLFPLPGPAAPRQFGTFFLAGVGDLNHDHVPDLYGGDYAAGDGGALGGFAAVYSGRDGTPLHSWIGAAGDGLGPGRGAGDINRDHVNDISVGSYTNSDGAPGAGKHPDLLRPQRAHAAHDHVDHGGREPRLRRGRDRRRQPRPPARPAGVGGRGRHALRHRGAPVACRHRRARPRIRPAVREFVSDERYGDWRFKLYGLADPAKGVRPELLDATRERAEASLPAEGYGAAFGIAHDAAYPIALVYWWQGTNELHQQLVRGRDDRGAGAGAVDARRLRVRELAVVEFERRAWIEDVIGNPEGPDLDRYLARRFGGLV